MKIIYDKERVMFEFQRFMPRSNPWSDDDCGKYPTFTGLIIKRNGFDELGFANTIDMNYADKDDQVGDFLVMWDGNQDEFIKKCEELGIDIQVYDYRNTRK